VLHLHCLCLQCCISTVYVCSVASSLFMSLQCCISIVYVCSVASPLFVSAALHLHCLSLQCCISTIYVSAVLHLHCLCLCSVSSPLFMSLQCCISTVYVCSVASPLLCLCSVSSPLWALPVDNEWTSRSLRYAEWRPNTKGHFIVGLCFCFCFCFQYTCEFRRLAIRFYSNCHLHPNPLIGAIGQYTLLDLIHMYKRYKHKRPNHSLL
jgi:hypothetical protein